MLSWFESKTINEDEDGLLYGTKIILNIFSLWAFNYRIVCAYSYFSSINTAEALKDIGLSFIGSTKTSI